MDEILCSEDTRGTTSRAAGENVSCREMVLATGVHDVHCSEILTTVTESSLVIDSSDTQKPSSNISGKGEEYVEEYGLSESPADESITLSKESEENTLICENAEERTSDHSSFSCLSSDHKTSGRACCTQETGGITVPVEDPANYQEEQTNVNQIHGKDKTAVRDPSLVENNAFIGIRVVGTCSDSVGNRLLNSANANDTLLVNNVSIAKDSVLEAVEASDVLQKCRSPEHSLDKASSTQKPHEIVGGSIPVLTENLSDLTHLSSSLIGVPSDNRLGSSGNLQAVDLQADSSSSSLQVLKQNQPVSFDNESVVIVASVVTTVKEDISVRMNTITCVETSAKQSLSCRDFPDLNSSDHAHIELSSTKNNDRNLPEDNYTIKTNSAQLSSDNSTLASNNSHPSETISVKTSMEVSSSVIQFRHDNPEDFPQTLFSSAVSDQLHVQVRIYCFFKIGFMKEKVE